MLNHEAQTNCSDQPKLTISQEAAQLALLVGEFVGLDKFVTVQLALHAASAVNPTLQAASDELKNM